MERTVTRLRPRFLLGLVATALAVLVAPAASASAGLGTPGAAPTASAMTSRRWPSGTPRSCAS